MTQRQFAVLARLTCGFMFSFSLSLLTRHYTMDAGWRTCPLVMQYPRYPTLAEETDAKGLVLVAVMTHMGTVETRAVGINETWAREIPGKLLFFVGQSEKTTKVDLPLIVLTVADEVYPPQRKALLMLKYIYEQYSDSFRWFIRADDDVYFCAVNLDRLLRSIDSDDDILLGHPGTGKKAEEGKLGLDIDSNFCIGGTGIVMAHSVLKKVYPHLDHCLAATATAHEDSEVGRCLRKFVGVQCPWGYEANELFYQDYGEPHVAYHGSLESLPFGKAISFHPVKDSRFQYRLHAHSLGLKARLNLHRAHILQKYFERTQKLLLMHERSPFQKTGTFHCHKDHCKQFHHKNFSHNEETDPRIWTVFREGKIYDAKPSSPVNFIHGVTEKGLQRVTKKAQSTLKENGKTQLYHNLYFGKSISGYLIHNPILGNVYEVQYLVRAKHFVDGRLETKRIPQRVKFKEPYGETVARTQGQNVEAESVNIVLPLPGYRKRFERFMKILGELLLKLRENVRLVVVFLKHSGSPKPYKTLLDQYRKRINHFSYVWLETDGRLNATSTLKTALKYFKQTDSLMLLSQVDYHFNIDFVKRCWQNTGKGKVYFPIPFKAYAIPNDSEKLLAHDVKSGRWSLKDFSIFCAYSNDVTTTSMMHAGNAGFSEKSWVDLLLSNQDQVTEIFRAPDPGLMHITTEL